MNRRSETGQTRAHQAQELTETDWRSVLRCCPSRSLRHGEVVDPGRIEAARPSGKSDLYVALTRALSG